MIIVRSTSLCFGHYLCHLMVSSVPWELDEVCGTLVLSLHGVVHAVYTLEY
jgi:hypothetical protein